MTTLEQATSALRADFVDKAARMAVRANGDPAVLSAAGAWMQAGERLADILELDRDDDTTRAENLSLVGEVNYQLTPVIGMLRRALAAASSSDDPDDITSLAATVFLSSADATLIVERLSAALAAIDPEEREPRPSVSEILEKHWLCDFQVFTDEQARRTNFVFDCGITASASTAEDSREGIIDVQRRHIATAIDAS